MAGRGTSKKFEALLRAYSEKPGIPVRQTPGRGKKSRGRPITRKDRPKRSAAKRTLPGEERYTITAKTLDIQQMKSIAKLMGDSIKEAFAIAMADYIAKHERVRRYEKQ